MEGTLRRYVATCVLIFACVVSSSSLVLADPIQYTADVYGVPWSNVRTGVPVDLVNGGTYPLDSASLDSPNSFLFWTNNSSSLNGTGYIDFGAYVPSGPSGSESTWVQIGVTVPITGSVQGNLLTTDLQGGDSGTGVSASFFPTVPSTLSIVPQPLLDLIADPGRIHIQAIITDGTQNDLVSTLTIDPLSIPEPTAVSVLLVAIGGVVLTRRMHASSSRLRFGLSASIELSDYFLRLFPPSCVRVASGGPRCPARAARRFSGVPNSNEVNVVKRPWESGRGKAVDLGYHRTEGSQIHSRRRDDLDRRARRGFHSRSSDLSVSRERTWHTSGGSRGMRPTSGFGFSCLGGRAWPARSRSPRCSSSSPSSCAGQPRSWQ